MTVELSEHLAAYRRWLLKVSGRSVIGHVPIRLERGTAGWSDETMERLGSMGCPNPMELEHALRSLAELGLVEVKTVTTTYWGTMDPAAMPRDAGFWYHVRAL